MTAHMRGLASYLSKITVPYLNGFLRDTRSSIARLGRDEKIHLVLGNQAADLDTCVSTIVFAYLLHCEGVRPILPVINFAQEDLSLRPEVKAALGTVGVDVDEGNLVFVDTEGGPLRRWQHRHVHLVDHNRLAPDQEDLENDVVEILDHHKDERRCLKAQQRRIVYPMGSCATLVAEYGLSRGHVFDEGIARLLLSTILIDTGNLDVSRGKTEAKDVEIAGKLSLACGLHKPRDRERAFNNLTDVISESALRISEYDSLRKDYKEFMMGPLRVGMSALYRDIGSIDTANLPKGIYDWMQKKHLDVLVLMTAYYKNGEFRRQLGVATLPERKEVHDPIVQHLSKVYSLKPVELSSTSSSSAHNPVLLRMFQQPDIQISRKQVQPQLLDFCLHSPLIQSKM